MGLRKMLGTGREDVTGDWRKLHSEELHGLYCSPNIIPASKSRRMRRAGRDARMGGKRNAYWTWCANMKKTDHVKSLGVDGDNIKMHLDVLGWDGVG
jgi:hypothetical protein